MPYPYYLLHNIGVNKWADCPWDATELTEVALYGDPHGGDNQQWQDEGGRIVSHGFPDMCLGAQQAQAGEPIVLVRADGPLTKDWIWSGESIVCAQDPSLRIGPNATNSAMQLQAASESDPGQHWEKQEAPDNEAKPATSCYLNYDGVTDSDVSDSWVLECTANVKESGDSTYYCMVGWGPDIHEG